MMQIGAGEFIVIVLLALVVLGPERLPNAARFVGQLMGSVRSMAGSFQTEIERASDGFIEDKARQKGQLQVDQERLNKAGPQAELETGEKGEPKRTSPWATASSDPDEARDEVNSQSSAPDHTDISEAHDLPDNHEAGDDAKAAHSDETVSDNGADPSDDPSSDDAASTNAEVPGSVDGLSLSAESGRPKLLEPSEPDRTEKAHSASMYHIGSNGTAPTSQLQGDVSQLLTAAPNELDALAQQGEASEVSAPHETTKAHADEATPELEPPRGHD